MKRVVGFILISIILCFCVSCSKKDEKQENFEAHKANIYFINAGKADSMLVSIDDKNYLIDTGTENSVKEIKMVLNNLNISKLDAVFISHTHDDHVGGLENLAEIVTIDNVYSAKISVPNKKDENIVEKIANKKALTHEYLEENDVIDIANDAKFEILGPVEYCKEEDNENSMVMKLYVNGKKILFTGDMQFQEEESLIKKDKNLKADILKVGNHGNKDATSEEFVEEVSPQIAIIPTDTNEDTNSANKKVIKRLSIDKENVFITQDYDMALDVNIALDGKITTKNLQKNDSNIQNGLSIENVSKSEQILYLKNTSNEEIDLGDCWIYSTKGGEIYSFERGTKIKQGDTITVSAKGYNGDFEMEDKTVWNEEKEDIAELYDYYGNKICECDSN